MDLTAFLPTLCFHPLIAPAFCVGYIKVLQVGSMSQACRLSVV